MINGLSQRSKMLLAMASVLLAAVFALALNEYLRDRVTIAAGGDFLPSSGRGTVGAPFALTDTNGRRVTDSDFRGRPMLVMFVEPSDATRTISALQVASAAITEVGGTARIAPVIVSIETTARAVAALGRMLAEVPSVSWTGLTGSDAEIDALAAAYFVARPRPKTAQRGAPPVGPPTVYLLDKRGAFVAHVVLPIDPARLTEWLQQKL